jgi:hypothetical protein
MTFPDLIYVEKSFHLEYRSGSHRRQTGSREDTVLGKSLESPPTTNQTLCHSGFSTAQSTNGKTREGFSQTRFNIYDST